MTPVERAATNLSGVEGDISSLETRVDDLEDISVGSVFNVLLCGARASAAPGANTLTTGRITVPWGTTLTGVGYFVGTVSNGNVLTALWDGDGALLASRSGVLAQGSANTAQQVAFDSPEVVPAGFYHIGILLSSATGTFYGAVGNSPSKLISPGGFTIPDPITEPLSSEYYGFVPQMWTF